MPTYFTVVLLLWKLILLNTQYPVYHELKGLHQSASASFIVSPSFHRAGYLVRLISSNN